MIKFLNNIILELGLSYDNSKHAMHLPYKPIKTKKNITPLKGEKEDLLTDESEFSTDLQGYQIHIKHNDDGFEQTRIGGLKNINVLTDADKKAISDFNATKKSNEPLIQLSWQG